MKTKYPYQQAFSQRLRLLLNEDRLSAAGLARKLNLPRSTVAKWLSGASAPDRPRLESVCQALKLDPRDFIPALADEAAAEREELLIAQSVRGYTLAVERADAAMIADALALTGAVVFVGLRRRGLSGTLVADESGVVQVVLRDADLASLRVVVNHVASRGSMCLQVKYADDAPAHAATFNITPVGLSALANALRGYAENARRVFHPKA